PVVNLVALDLVFGLDDVAGLRIDRLVADAVAGLAIDDVQANPGRRARCGVHRDRARDERELQVSLPDGTRCHDRTRAFDAAGGEMERHPIPLGSRDQPPDQGLSWNGGAISIKSDLRFPSHCDVRLGKYYAFPAP